MLSSNIMDVKLFLAKHRTGVKEEIVHHLSNDSSMPKDREARANHRKLRQNLLELIDGTHAEQQAMPPSHHPSQERHGEHGNAVQQDSGLENYFTGRTIAVDGLIRLWRKGLTSVEDARRFSRSIHTENTLEDYSLLHQVDNDAIIADIIRRTPA